MLGNRSHHDIDARPGSLPALAAVALASVLASALVTTAVLIVADRYQRPPLIVADGALPTIVVQIDGAVATPGPYRLPGGARLDDVVGRAGGLTEDADVASVNLAARVGDGESVSIPAQSTAMPSPSVAGTAAAAERFNINTASATQLAELPGIGPVLSERIVAYRDENGPFASLDELVEVDGISAGLLGELRPLITLDD